MLTSVTIARRQSEIRQALSTLAGKPTPTEDETRQMEQLDGEYRQNETRYRAALIAEDTERREAGADLETRSGREWSEMVAGYELRQVVRALEEGRALSGRTAEVVAELRNAGGYRGVPVPLMALEQRAGETVASGTPDPLQTRPIIDRLFPASVAAQMGVQLITIGSGAVEWPVTTSAVSAGWADGELANVAGPTAYATTDKALKPEQTLGIHMRISRKAMLQSGDALEAAIRRDMSGTMSAELDKAIFRGTGANGQPLGLIPGVSTYGITSTAVGAAASWAAIRAAVVRFMTANAAAGPGEVKALIRPELWSYLDGILVSDSGFKFEFDRLKENLGGIVMSSNALAAPSGSPLATSALLATSAGGVAPAFVGLWGAFDLIRDPYSDAQSGGVRLTALTTADVTVARGAQLELVTGLQVA
ncbi:phage major capsid protein [Rhodobacter sphaeroides]|uniref:Phage major capsid protein, HK97 family n=1 Tax=Cereibacter sphaeroides (strain ATCC 17023 / DSM 158 / JCM 6121 / CCUG 31486 / LMG 2827 / NBRC 12203 / NCIMB 8253 / ATH 2.4.1.) TaxID=272943 RepID=Q3J1F3_CERS4|nr:phage major capsid protein [Cereibacter sphaeroides]ABA79381.2 phage major capsid protein, HK97 family [Cereibacter sphaeroides 2.4.1]ANS34390.1 major capsid protein [Cereibacter sphaeroides]ATN63435.1 major capsid protein [Cereibacter sphaeroides]AXC61596.1 phage major capsid protein [Cereibacter sphaeroides 2.4.1]MVX47443.1 phage major capsid protein [Cereibacter sphaeroides]